MPEGCLAVEDISRAPHLDSATQHARGKMGAPAVESLGAHFAGNPLLKFGALEC